MHAFASLSFNCQSRQEGEGACLVKPAFRLTQHTRRLACLFGDGVAAYANNDNDRHT